MPPYNAHEPVVISSAGVISSIGAGLEQFQAALYEGASGIGPSEMFGPEAVTAEVRNFSPQQWLGNKGLRILDRSTRLLCVAAHMAISGSGLRADAPPEEFPEVGLVCGTLFGGLHSIASFDWSGLTDGPNYVSPMEFPNTVINSPAGQTAIRFRLRGGNSTVCGGMSAGLYAMHYAAEFLRMGRERMLLAGGVEELCEESLVGFRKIGALSPSGMLRPFGANHDGTVLGEGAVLHVVETARAAQERGAKAWAEISGFGCAHDAHSINEYDARAEGASWAIRQAMESAGVQPEQIACIISGAAGNPSGDAVELRALKNSFGKRLEEMPVCAPKAAFGETMGAGGAYLTLVATMALEKQEIPPTANFSGAANGLRLASTPQSVQGEYALVTAFSCDGNNAALILKAGGA